ncbi:cupin domain-containing protein [Streptomyces sp. SID9124]|uniref:JmjC domain-containing protein n=1 Tax=Streptomyces sp. SID9124 TaxID=2706108 RepID=UPI0013DEF109|nr:cupin domain-containing protein [Streptomyces sp. SID9124]NED13053.1 cupin [Streptomyces sp. SID9124]
MPRHFRHGADHRALLGKEGLDAVLDCGLLRTPYAEVVHHGAKLPQEEYCEARQIRAVRADGFVAPDRVRALLDDGATLVLPRTDQWHGATAELAAAYTAHTGRRTYAYSFFTRDGAPGVDVHRDDSDVIMIQTAGSKHWKVYEPPVDGDWGEGPTRDPGQLVLEIELRAGEALYVPRGCAHAGVGGSTFSGHLSLTLPQPGLMELRQGLVRLLSTTGRELPPRPVGRAAMREAAHRLLADARDRLDALTPEDLLAQAEREQARREAGRRRGSAP